MDPSSARLGACELLLGGGGGGGAQEALGGLEAALVQLGAREVLINKVWAGGMGLRVGGE